MSSAPIEIIVIITGVMVLVEPITDLVDTGDASIRATLECRYHGQMCIGAAGQQDDILHGMGQ